MQTKLTNYTQLTAFTHLHERYKLLQDLMWNPKQSTRPYKKYTMLNNQMTKWRIMDKHGFKNTVANICEASLFYSYSMVTDFTS